MVLNESRRKRARELSAFGRKATPGPLRATKCACPATSPRRTADADATNGEPDPDATVDGNIDARSCFRLLMRLPVNDSSPRVAEDGGLSCREAAETEPRLMTISSAQRELGVLAFADTRAAKHSTLYDWCRIFVGRYL